MSLCIGLDVGTQGAKAVVYDRSTRKIVARGSASYDIVSGPNGRAEQAPSTWIQGATMAVKQAVSALPNREAVHGIGVSGQQHGLVLLDEQKQVLRPAKLWCDTESAAEAAEISKKLNFTIVPAFTASKALWVSRHEPHVWARARHVLLPHDYVNFFLTGRMVMEAGDASGTGLFDVAGRCWDEKAAALVDERLPGMLPPLIGHNEVVGTMLPAVAADLGLGPGAIMVAPGSGDNACSALGAGAVRDGQVIVSLGTSGTLFAKSSAPILDPSGGIAPFCDATGAWLPLVCTLNCTRVLEEVRGALQGRLTHDELTSLAAAVPPGCGGVTWLPYMMGERTPNWPHASGTILGLRAGSLSSPGLLYRAGMEGATFSLLRGLRAMQEKGLTPRELRLVGGGAKNRLWRQVLADAFQLPIRLPLEAESAALGAALQAAAVCSGSDVAEFIQEHEPPVDDEVVLPDANVAEQYAAAFQQFIKYGEVLFGTNVSSS